MYLLVGTMVLSVALLGMLVGVEALLSSYNTAWQPNFIGVWSLGAIACSIQLYRRKSSGRWMLVALTLVSFSFWIWFVVDELLQFRFGRLFSLANADSALGLGMLLFFTGVHVFFGWVGYHPMLFDKETIVEEEGDTDRVLDVW